MRHAIRSIFVKITLFVTEVSCLFVRAMVMRSLADREPLLRIQNTGFSLDPLKSFAELDTLNFPQTSLNLCPPILQAGGIPGLRLKRHCWILFASVVLLFPRSGCLGCYPGPLLIPAFTCETIPIPIAPSHTCTVEAVDIQHVHPTDNLFHSLQTP